MSDPDIHLLITVPFPAGHLERLQAISPRLKITSRPTSDAETLEEDLLQETEILYTLGALPDPDLVPNLRWIQVHYAGVDHILGNPLLNSDLMITTMSGVSAPQLAELSLMFILALSHRLLKIFNSTPEERWAPGRLKRYQPRELRGSTVGIVGYGSLGREIARLCTAAGAKILATKRDLKNLADDGYTHEGLGDPEAEIPERLYPPEALRSMVSLCDFVIVTLPLTAKTKGVYDESVFEAMKPSAYLVDVSRGGVVDHGALVEALNLERLAGAALDVYPIEPLPESSPLWEMDNVLLTPHIGGASPEYLEQAIQFFALNIQRYLSEMPLLNVFDPSREY
jgi:phosphoglycerate dehydrogenase-like enzyme